MRSHKDLPRWCSYQILGLGILDLDNHLHQIDKIQYCTTTNTSHQQSNEDNRKVSKIIRHNHVNHNYILLQNSLVSTNHLQLTHIDILGCIHLLTLGCRCLLACFLDLEEALEVSNEKSPQQGLQFKFPSINNNFK